MSDRERPGPAGWATMGEFNAFLAEHGEIDYLDAVFVDMCGTVRGKRFPSEEAYCTSKHSITEVSSCWAEAVPPSTLAN